MKSAAKQLFFGRLYFEFFLDFLNVDTLHNGLGILNFQRRSAAGSFGFILAVLAFESGY
jgi:hypothetical protein